jgi:hypothetical protein
MKPPLLFKSTTLIAGMGACAAVGAAIGIAAAFGAFSRGASHSGTTASAYVRPHVPPGVVLRQNARAVERRVRQSLGAHAVITSVVVVAHRRETSRVIGGTGPEIEHGGPAWIVRARGLFQPVTIPPGGHFRAAQRHGYVVIDDRTGRTLAYGFGG